MIRLNSREHKDIAEHFVSKQCCAAPLFLSDCAAKHAGVGCYLFVVVGRTALYFFFSFFVLFSFSLASFLFSFFSLIFIGYVYHVTTERSLGGQLKCDNQSINQSIKSNQINPSITPWVSLVFFFEKIHNYSFSPSLGCVLVFPDPVVQQNHHGNHPFSPVL